MDENQELIDQQLTEQQAPEEKLIPQSQLNKIVGREKETAYLRGKREAEEEYQRKMQELAANQSQYAGSPPQDKQIDADKIYQQVQERFNQEMQQRQLEQELSRVANDYHSKMQQGKSLYEDFDDVTKDFDPTAFPQLVYLVSGIENAADVIYDLAKNPSKLVTLDTLAQRSPKQAQAELMKLSRSIAGNQQALNEAQYQDTPAPLDRLQPSRVSGSNGKQTIRDLRAMPWLKG